MIDQIPLVLGLTTILDGREGKTKQYVFLMLILTYCALALMGNPLATGGVWEKLVFLIVGYFIKDAEGKKKK